MAALESSSEIHQINEGKLQIAPKDALEEKPKVLGILKLFSQEAEGGWEGRLN